MNWGQASLTRLFCLITMSDQDGAVNTLKCQYLSLSHDFALV